MNKTTSTLLTAAVTGLFLGSVSTLSSCTKTSDTKTEGGGAMAVAEKHACAKLNTCKAKGGCSTGDQGCKAKNSCSGKGGCATVKHDCATKNECKAQGGCKGTAGKNTCSGKGGCKVPVAH